jgi:hypothetical protein
MAIAFCACRSNKGDAVPQFRQLVTAGLFPATLAQPESVFTFDVLDNWHQHALTSKKSAHDYHDALRKLTNPVFLSDVPVSVFSHSFRVKLTGFFSKRIVLRNLPLYLG